MKSKRNKLIPIIFICCLILSTITVSFAWFLNNRLLKVKDNEEITCTVGNSLEIRMKQKDGLYGEWTKEVKKDIQKIKLEDISGNGLNLYKPDAFKKDPSNNIVPTSFAVASPANEDGYGDYIEFEIQLRSKSYIDVYLSEDSSISPVNKDVNQNIFGDFSVNFIAGAMRVAVIEKDLASENLKMIWAPNPNYELIKNENDTYTFNEFGNVEEYSYFEKSNDVYVKKTVSPQQYADKQFVYGSTQTNSKMVNNSPILTTLDPFAGLTDGYAVKNLVFRIWFEGTDRESLEALSGGKVNMNLSLIGNYPKEDCLAENQKIINDIQYDSAQNQFTNLSSTQDIYFSVNGHTWIKYNPDKYNLPNMRDIMNISQTDATIYFRYNETLSNKEFIRKMTITYQS